MSEMFDVLKVVYKIFLLLLFLLFYVWNNLIKYYRILLEMQQSDSHLLIIDANELYQSHSTSIQIQQQQQQKQ